MHKIKNNVKSLVFLILVTIPNFANNTFVFKREYVPEDYSIHIESSINHVINKKKLYNYIANIESKGKYNVANAQNMIGKYQASVNTLLDFGYSEEEVDAICKSVYAVEIGNNKIRYYFDTELFPPSEQERFIRWYMAKMEKTYLKKYIDEYVGKMVGGVVITKAGILHASMLGHGNVIKYLESNGKTNFSPRRGFSVKQRLQQLEDTELLCAIEMH